MIKMIGVREYCNDLDVELDNEKERLVVCAYAEGGFASTCVDLLDIIEWLRKNMPELLRPELLREDSGHD